MVGVLLKDIRGLHLATLDTHGVRDRREWLLPETRCYGMRSQNYSPLFATLDLPCMLALIV